MKLHPLAGTGVPRDLLVDVDRLQEAYYSRQPDCADSSQRVRFGTSGHRGSSLRGAFNTTHILAITQGLCEYQSARTSPVLSSSATITHALSEAAFRTAVEALAVNGVETVIDRSEGYTPTPAISHTILNHSRGRSRVPLTASSSRPRTNPPEDGGFWARPIAERYGIDIQLVNDTVDPTFSFMSLDWDGRVRMDIGRSATARLPSAGTRPPWKPNRSWRESVAPAGR